MSGSILSGSKLLVSHISRASRLVSCQLHHFLLMSSFVRGVEKFRLVSCLTRRQGEKTCPERWMFLCAEISSRSRHIFHQPDKQGTNMVTRSQFSMSHSEYGIIFCCSIVDHGSEQNFSMSYSEL